jgi:hypothetical protein
MKRLVKVLAAVLSLMLVLIWTPPVWAYRDWDRTPLEVDALLVRPAGILSIGLGLAGFLATLPFAIITGTTEESANRFVVDPFRFTFERPLSYPTYDYPDSGW